MSAVNDGRCSPWVMCSCSVVSGNQIRDNYLLKFVTLETHFSGRKQKVNV